jgi:hypothetical protein
MRLCQPRCLAAGRFVDSYHHHGDDSRYPGSAENGINVLVENPVVQVAMAVK